MIDFYTNLLDSYMNIIHYRLTGSIIHDKGGYSTGSNQLLTVQGKHLLEYYNIITTQKYKFKELVKKYKGDELKKHGSNILIELMKKINKVIIYDYDISQVHEVSPWDSLDDLMMQKNNDAEQNKSGEPKELQDIYEVYEAPGYPIRPAGLGLVAGVISPATQYIADEKADRKADEEEEEEDNGIGLGFDISSSASPSIENINKLLKKGGGKEEVTFKTWSDTDRDPKISPMQHAKSLMNSYMRVVLYHCERYPYLQAVKDQYIKTLKQLDDSQKHFDRDENEFKLYQGRIKYVYFKNVIEKKFESFHKMIVPILSYNYFIINSNLTFSDEEVCKLSSKKGGVSWNPAAESHKPNYNFPYGYNNIPSVATFRASDPAVHEIMAGSSESSCNIF